MKRTALLLTVLLLVAGTATAQSLAFTDVTVIDVAEGVVEPGMTVVVIGNRIAAVGETGAVAVPTGATVVDGKGKYLIPSLWDMHVHLNSMWHRHVTVEQREAMLALLVANGVTGVRDMGGGLEQIQAWRMHIRSGDLLGPRIVTAGQFLDHDPPVWPHAIPVDTPAEARQAVQMLSRRGVDFLKVYAKLRRDEYFAIADEAGRLGLWYAGHLPNRVDVEEAVEAGQRSFEHLQGFAWRCTDLTEVFAREVREIAGPESPGLNVHFGLDPRVLERFDVRHCKPLLDLLAGSRVWHTPTLMVHPGGLRDAPHRIAPRLRYVPEAMQAHWRADVGFDLGAVPSSVAELWRRQLEIHQQLTASMVRAGIPILAGSDTWSGAPYAVPGFSLHDELALLEQAGLSPLEALRAATLEPARYLAREYELGSVEYGKLADLVLLDANPLDDISNTQRIRAVVANGRYFDRQALDALLAEAERAAAQN